MSDNKELYDIFELFTDKKPISFETIDSSRGESDFREVVIAELETGEKMVIKLADNDFTFPDKIKMWQRTTEEYLALGYYCPRIIADKNGEFPYIKYKGHGCAAYAEEYAVYRCAENPSGDNKGEIPVSKYEKDVLKMIARVASKHFSYTDYPSAYCLFDTFCPSDKTDEVLETAIEWKKCADALPTEFQTQVQRIWEQWTANRNALEPIYRKLPTSVFQADVNPTNILLDEQECFVGIYDFNICGKDVVLNYLFRDTYYGGYQKELDEILNRLQFVRSYYTFSELEKQTAQMLYRCVKPLYYMGDELKKLGDDREAIKKALDETEYFLTRDIDFRAFME